MQGIQCSVCNSCSDSTGLATELPSKPPKQIITAQNLNMVLFFYPCCRHNKNLNTDAWRTHQLWRHTANPSNPFNRFSTGNLDTLLHTPKVIGTSQLPQSCTQAWLASGIFPSHYSAVACARGVGTTRERRVQCILFREPSCGNVVCALHQV